MTNELLILSYPGDIHFQAVDWGLRQAGIEADLLFGNCFPNCEEQSLFIDQNALSYHAYDVRGRQIDLLAAKTVWMRRGIWPTISSQVDDVDQKAAKDEAEMFIRGVRSLAQREQRWINPLDFDTIAGRKPFQLYAAKAAGLQIPRSLMSNNPKDIQDFFASAPGDVLYKPFTSLIWENEDGFATLYANKVTLDDIKDLDALKYTSHLFQDYIDKAYELRIIYLGGEIYACTLHSQDNERGKVDWRILNSKELRPEYHHLPQHVSTSLKNYMKIMGLEYGAIDMIVDKQGNYVFLECNPAGQFLFLEQWNPDLSILSRFLSFFTKDINITKAQQEKLKTLRLESFFNDPDREDYYKSLAMEYPVRYQPDLTHKENSKDQQALQAAS